MIRRMQCVMWCKRTIAMNEWKERIITWTQTNGVDMALSVLNGSTAAMNSVLSIQSTHVGLTNDDRPAVGDKVIAGDHVYLVDYAIDGCRYRQLMLSECDAL